MIASAGLQNPRASQPANSFGGISPLIGGQLAVRLETQCGFAAPS